jgi:hypothetical protein
MGRNAIRFALAPLNDTDFLDILIITSFTLWFLDVFPQHMAVRHSLEDICVQEQTSVFQTLSSLRVNLSSNKYL